MVDHSFNHAVSWDLGPFGPDLGPDLGPGPGPELDNKTLLHEE